MIAQEQIESVVQVIVEGYEPMKIILLGSYAYGHPTKDSDLDLLIIKDGETSGIQRNRCVRNILKDFSILIDVIVKSSQEFDMLKDVIGTVIYPANKYGKVVYEQK
ncbi:MAG TPA: nucleotidyltransferase domain-containing protein [Methanosarcinales archaeon]|nr:nucleotidyltransferase domain-containing protein [Methanosarcinales archaeon]